MLSSMRVKDTNFKPKWHKSEGLAKTSVIESLRSLLAEIRLDREVGGGAGSRY